MLEGGATSHRQSARPPPCRAIISTSPTARPSCPTMRAWTCPATPPRSRMPASSPATCGPARRCRAGTGRLVRRHPRRARQEDRRSADRRCLRGRLERQRLAPTSLRSFPRKRESRDAIAPPEASALGPRFRGDERQDSRQRALSAKPIRQSKEGPSSRTALPLSGRGPVTLAERPCASLPADGLGQLAKGPRQRRGSSSDMPATAAIDNETLDHLLSVVNGPAQYRGSSAIWKPGAERHCLARPYDEFPRLPTSPIPASPDPALPK